MTPSRDDLNASAAGAFGDDPILVSSDVRDALQMLSAKEFANDLILRRTLRLELVGGKALEWRKSDEISAAYQDADLNLADTVTGAMEGLLDERLLSALDTRGRAAFDIDAKAKLQTEDLAQAQDGAGLAFETDPGLFDESLNRARFKLTGNPQKFQDAEALIGRDLDGNVLVRSDSQIVLRSTDPKISAKGDVVLKKDWFDKASLAELSSTNQARISLSFADSDYAGEGRKIRAVARPLAQAKEADAAGSADKPQSQRGMRR